MTTTTQEKEKDDSEQRRIVEDKTSTKVEEDKPTSEKVVSPSSMLVSGLGSGELEPIEKISKKKRRKKKDKEEDTGPTSGEVLSGLARPKIFEGPDVKLQKKIVTRLEAAIPGLDKTAVETRRLLEDEIGVWDGEFNLTGHTPEEYKQHDSELTKRNKMLPTDRYDRDLLYLGSIELTDIPSTMEAEESLLDDAELVASDNHALQSSENGTALPEAAGVRRQIVRNTLLTMIKAGQMDYLRTSGFVGTGWKVVIEVHYYRDRSGNKPNLHKDTLGQTMFVNLNYTNDEEMPGPEFVANPPLVKTHENELEKTLPQKFRDDLDQARGTMDKPTMIETGILPPHSVVSFVDETIHHATPLLGHRQVRLDKVRKFLAEDQDFARNFALADVAYEKSIKKTKGLFQLFQKPKQFRVLFDVELNDEEKEQWRALMELCSGPVDLEVDRPVLFKHGLTHQQIDRLLSGYGPDTFNSVNIPAKAREDRTTGRIPMTRDKKGKKPLQLTRQMSLLALDDKLPEEPEGPRRFFRTWVRTVRTDT